jgi:uncharacterized membrane protein
MTLKFPYNTVKFAACAIGLIVSIYAESIHRSHNLDPEYVATCDMSETISCSDVLLSEFGHIFSKFGLVPKSSILDHSNAAYGKRVSDSI